MSLHGTKFTAKVCKWLTIVSETEHVTPEICPTWINDILNFNDLRKKQHKTSMIQVKSQIFLK